MPLDKQRKRARDRARDQRLYKTDPKFKKLKQQRARDNWKKRRDAGQLSNVSKDELRLKLKQEVLFAYSVNGGCACCGERHLEFLGLDHIKGGGRIHRTKETQRSLYYRLRREGFPTGEYRTLCHNCNFSYGLFGYCPHQGGLTREGLICSNVSET